MAKIALYRKYRPHNFDNLVGQDHVKSTLINAIKTDAVAHAYLFSGPRGTGKTSTARLVAKAINCQALKDGFEPCDECELCKSINEGKLIDLIEIDAASNRGIDEVRDLKEKIAFSPNHSKYKVYIIDEVHMMTKEAFNALLKTLEEPPAHAYFILATTEIHKIPETIISRCQRFDFKRVGTKALLTRLSYIAQKEEIVAEQEALEIISKYVDVGLRDGIGLLEQLSRDGALKTDYARDILGVSGKSLLADLLSYILNDETDKAVKLIHNVHDQGSDLRQFLHDFIEDMRRELLESVEKGEDTKIKKLVEMIENFQEAQLKVHAVTIPQLSLEIAVIKSTREIAKPIKVEVEKEEEKVKVVEKEVEVSSSDKSLESTPELTLKILESQWPRITERIKAPSLRMSLKSAKPIKVEESEVVLQLGTNFHRDKIMEHDHRVELEETIREIFDKSVKLACIVREIEIKPVIEEEKPEKVDLKKPSSTSVNEALEIFGGELVE